MKNAFLKIALISLTILISCTKSKKEDSKLSTINPGSKEFTIELARKIKDNNGQLTYIFKKYRAQGLQEYLDVDIKGSDFYVTATILVDNWKKLSRIKDNKGIGYCGAELDGLQLSLTKHANRVILKYKDVKGIID
ncbi:hypothetical protein ACFOWA_13520 [Pedobacter lithocola]|uniref:Lipoprotein n=1 Tax=Pedobacter lithocola TaxID=1908239 RepID=A0ABV8PD21_9SPHI